MSRKDSKFNLLDYFEIESSYATEFRRLLHNLNGVPAAERPKTILVTSAMLAEGKSTVVSFMAITSARHKQRKTLLIDFDLRRPTMHRLFSLPREEGVVDVLLGEKRAKDVIKKTSDQYLDILTVGKYIPHPTEIFDSGRIHSLIEEVKFYYDLILVDCAPVLPVSDPMLLASEMDGVVLVIKAGATQREVVKRAWELIHNAKAHLLGVVLNNYDNILPYYYRDTYYGYESRPSR